MNLTADDWYNLGHETGEVTKVMEHIKIIFEGRFGCKNRYTKICYKLLNLYPKIESNLLNRL